MKHHNLIMSDITLYFLHASRSIRIAWLLGELGLDYKLETYDRESTGLAPTGFKESCGTVLGKAPVLKDGPLILQESGAITEYVPHPPPPQWNISSHSSTRSDRMAQISLREL